MIVELGRKFSLIITLSKGWNLDTELFKKMLERETNLKVSDVKLLEVELSFEEHK
jgi:hypothetical protein